MTDSMTAKGENGGSPLQILKTAVSLPAIAVAASGAYIFKNQAEGEPPVPSRNPLLKWFTDRGKKADSCEKALQHLERIEKDLQQLKEDMCVLEYWIEVDITIEDIRFRTNNLRNDDLLQLRIRSLTRDWKTVADNYNMYKSAVSTVQL